MHKKQLISFNLILFLSLAILTFALITLETSFFIQVNFSFYKDYVSVAHKLPLPSIVIPDLVYFFIKQLAIHAFYSLIVFFCIIFFGYLFKLSDDDKFKSALILWFTGVAAVFCANYYYFPNSKFSSLVNLFVPFTSEALWLALTFGSVFLLALCLAVIGFFVWLTRKSFNYTLLFLLFAAASSWTVLNKFEATPVYPRTFAHPNVFIIGVDSLRPDYLSYFGAEYVTPNIDNFLNHATVFGEAITPIARTFPSWASILTGEYPRHNGIRTNLVKVDKMDLSHSMPNLFKQNGYKTIYATDETRFSNINHQFGFEEIITPPVGINDFLIGTFNDFPFSNLLINTELGKKLFPHSYGNRPAFATYDPSSFINLIKPVVMQTQTQPLFMAVHFCLPHQPYLYANIDGDALTMRERYLVSVLRVDQQVQELLNVLRQAHLLDHSIVVLLSDHGEAMELHGDRITERDNFLASKNHKTFSRFYPPSLDAEEVDQSGGHGTDVLGITQYHSLLAIQLFGAGQQRVGDVPGIAPLNNLQDSLLSLAGFTKQARQPLMLADAVRGTVLQMPLQHFFIESDFSPSAVRSVFPQIHEALMDGLSIYEIDPKTALLNVRADMQDKIMNSKQYADIYGDWMLALYPNEHREFMPILVNLQTGQWTNNLQSSFATKAPSQLMMAQLKQFFGEEIAH